MRPQYEEVSRFETPRQRETLLCSFCNEPLESAAAPQDLLKMFGKLLCRRCERLVEMSGRKR
jgi:hypothetical protein